MSRKPIVLLVLISALILSGCSVQSGNDVDEVPGTQDSLNIPSTEKDDADSEPVTPNTSEIAPESTEQNTDNTVKGGSISDNTHKDVTYEVSARLHNDMPEYRFVAMGTTQGTDEYGIGFIMGMKVFDEKGQLILSEDFSETYGDEVYGYAVYNEMMDTMGLHIVDVNFDGYRDVIILNEFSGAHANTWYDCWLWDPETSSFAASESFAQICNPSLDPEQKCIFSTGGSGAAFWGGSIYKFMDGEFVLTNDLYTDWSGLQETALVDGKMTVVREVNYPDDDEEKAAEMVAAEMKYYQDSELWQLDNPRWYWVGGHEADKWLER